MKIIRTSFVVIVTVVTTLSFIQCKVNFKVLDPLQHPGTPTFSATREREGKTLKANSVCECNLESGKEGIMCANNGVVYKNVCHFNCAKKKNPRLKIVQTGKSCAGLNRKDFWGAGTTTKLGAFGLDLLGYFNEA